MFWSQKKYYGPGFLEFEESSMSPVQGYPQREKSDGSSYAFSHAHELNKNDVKCSLRFRKQKQKKKKVFCMGCRLRLEVSSEKKVKCNKCESNFNCINVYCVRVVSLMMILQILWKRVRTQILNGRWQTKIH